jgi:hypothetical protein
MIVLQILQNAMFPLVKDLFLSSSNSYKKIMG